MAWYEETIDSNGNYPSDDGLRWTGGLVDFSVSGTWNGATAKLQVKHADTWYDVDSTDASFSADGTAIIRQGSGKSLRINVADGPTSLKLYLDPV